MSAASIERLRSSLGPELVERLEQPYGERERPEERLLDLGLIDDGQLAAEIAERSGCELTSLRGVEPELGLFLYLPLDLAERETVFPLILVGDRLTVASAFLDPDLSAVAAHVPKLELDVVIAARAEIRALLEQIRGGAA